MRRQTSRILMVLLVGMAACSPSGDTDGAAKSPDSKNGITTGSQQVNVAASEEVILPIEGMHCEGCEGLIRAELEKLAGVESAEPRYAEHRAIIRYDPDQVTVAQLMETVTGIQGYTALDPSEPLPGGVSATMPASATP